MALIQKWNCPECGNTNEGLPYCGGCGYKLIDHEAEPRTDAIKIAGHVSDFMPTQDRNVWIVAFRYDSMTMHPLEGQLTIMPSILTNEPPVKKGDAIHITIVKSKTKEEKTDG